MNTELEKPVSEANTGGQSLNGGQPQAQTVNYTTHAHHVNASQQNLTECEPSELERARLNKYHQAAQIYLAAGLCALPLERGTKKPAVCWKEFQRKRPKPEQLTSWWLKFPTAELCFVTGSVSGIIDIEIDPRHEGLKDLAALEREYGPLPATPTFLTGRGDGGKHMLFACPKGKKYQSCKLADGVEVRAEGNISVLPPSRHKDTGYEYAWADGLTLADVDIAPLPDEWLKALSPYKGDKGEIRGEAREQGKQVLNTCTPAPTVEAAVNAAVCGTDLRKWFSCVEFMPAICRVLGIPAEAAEHLAENGRGSSFSCVIPDMKGTPEKHRHQPDKNPSASLYLEPGSGCIVYHDWHAKSYSAKLDRHKQFYTLPEIRAAQAYGYAVELNTPEHNTWGWRLLVEAGVVKPAQVEAEPLPEGVKPAIKQVYEGFLLLLACKWLQSHGEATPFSWRFAKVWCGLTERNAGKAMKRLLESGIIRYAPTKHDMGEGRRALTLLLPGKCTKAWKLFSYDDEEEGEV